MIEFVRNNFRKWFNVALWIIFIGFILAGLTFGSFAGKNYSGNDVMYQIFGALIGAALGTLVGLIVIIIFGGWGATFLNIDKNIQIIVNNYLQKNGEKSWHKKYSTLYVLDIMKTPDRNAEKLISLKKDEIVLFLDEAYEEIETKTIWYKVNYKNLEGWCKSNELKKYYE